MKLFPIKVRWNIYPYIEQLRKLNKTKNSTHFNTTHNMYTLKFRKLDVATPLWAKCEGEAHTPKSGNLESSGTREISELELKGQNTSHWGVLCVIGKVLKCRCLNWPRIGHLDICSPSYGQKKGWEVVWLPTTKSRESTSSQRLQREWDTALESSRRELQLWFKPRPDPSSGQEVMVPQSPGSPNRDSFGTVSGLLLGSRHLDVASARSCREYYKGEGGGFPRVRAMVNQVSPS
jgi:hypothetical protein